MKSNQLLVLGLMALGLAGNGYVSDANAEALNVNWKNGLNLESADGAVKLKLGGRIHNDWAWFLKTDDTLEEAVGEQQDGTEIRRARLAFSGVINDQLEFASQYDFAGGDANFKDMYVGLKKTAIGNVRVGQQAEPIGFEASQSSNYYPLMELGFPAGVFSLPSYKTGLLVINTMADKNVFCAVGVFRDTDNFGNGTGEDDAYNFTGRITAVPFAQDDDKTLMHVGLGYSFRDATGGELRFRDRPEAHLASRFIDTDDFAADGQDWLGLEFATVLGSLSLQAEVMNAFVDAPAVNDPSFLTYYALVSYFITGESRPYERSSAVFGRVKPNSPFVGGNGDGAIELLARYSHADLNDGDILGGEIDDVTLGVNWYLHANARVMLNYIYASQDTIGDAHILQNRFQVDF